MRGASTSERASFSIRPLATPQDSAVQHVTLRLAGPTRPGRYPLILFFDAEDGVEYLALGTNWLMRTPVWHEGNDVADWTEEQLARANRVGSVAVRRAYPGPVTHRDAWVPATVLYIEAAQRERSVTPPAGPSPTRRSPTR